jgi:hypothetical protein
MMLDDSEIDVGRDSISQPIREQPADEDRMLRFELRRHAAVVDFHHADASAVVLSG